MMNKRKHPALGILFKGSMVRAILAGDKTQTRRIMKVQPPADTDLLRYKIATTVSSTSAKDEGKHHWLGIDRTLDYNALDTTQPYFNCPLIVGEVLYVKETWQPFDGTFSRCVFRADARAVPGFPGLWWRNENGVDLPCEPRWKSSLFMPYKAARIFLKVTGVRVERLNDISKADAIAEGISGMNDGFIGGYKDYTWPGPGGNDHYLNAYNSYATLWESINGKDSWKDNPYVWVYTFEVTSKPSK